jgi:hypothetical protein
MANDLNNDSNLHEVFTNNNILPHASSGDPVGTTKAAKLLFSSDASVTVSTSVLLDGGAERFMPNQMAITSTIRAVCRIYLVDFICFKYDLPPICEDMKLDIPFAV